MNDRDLEKMLRRFRKLLPEDKVRIQSSLSPAERVTLGRLLNPPAADSCSLSRELAQGIEQARDDWKASSMTEAGAKAFVRAFDRMQTEPSQISAPISLVGKLFQMLTGQKV